MSPSPEELPQQDPTVGSATAPFLDPALASLDPATLKGPWTHRMVHVRGQRLHVAEVGAADAPLVLLVHGSTGGWFEWRKVLPLLCDAPFHTVAVSLRGYAPSDRTPNGYSPITAADDLSGLIRALGYKSAIVAGQGFGTWVAWTLAARHPRTVDGIVSCGAVHPVVWGAQMRRPWARGFRSAVASTWRSAVSTSLPSMPARVQRKLRGREGAEQRIISRIVSAALADTGRVEDGGPLVTYFRETEAGAEFAALKRYSLQKGALRPALEHLEWWMHPWPGSFMRWLRCLRESLLVDAPLPTIALTGSEDFKAPERLVRAYPIPLSELVVVDGAGHYLPEEAPAAVADAIRRMAAKS